MLVSVEEEMVAGTRGEVEEETAAGTRAKWQTRFRHRDRQAGDARPKGCEISIAPESHTITCD